MSTHQPLTQVQPFLDSTTETWSYVVYDHPGGSAAVIDPVLDYACASGRTGEQGAHKIIEFLRAEKLTLEWILETHVHADHVSAAPLIRQQCGGKIAIGDRIRDVQTHFREVFNLGEAFLSDGSQFDYLFSSTERGEQFELGELKAQTLYVPGHTSADMAWLIGDAVFVGDTLFMPDVGSARCDFPGGDAATLYRSVRKLLSLPAQTRLFVCHDYPPAGGREHRCETTVGEQKRNNIHLHQGVSEVEFVAMRQQCDSKLAMPHLILPSIQINIRAGHLPDTEDNGTAYLKIPINRL